MVCCEVRETGPGTSRTRPSERLFRHLSCPPAQSRRFSLDTGMRPVSNACSVEPGEVPHNEVNAHLMRNPGVYYPLNSVIGARFNRRSGRPSDIPRGSWSQPGLPGSSCHSPHDRSMEIFENVNKLYG